MNFKSSLYILIAFLFFTQIVSTQNIIIEGSVVDEFDYEVPFAAVGILKKNIGTTSTMEGTFSFLVTKNELSDVLEISSIGFETIKINVQDFVNRKDKKIILGLADIPALNERYVGYSNVAYKFTNNKSII